MADQERINKNATFFSIGTIILIVLLAAIAAGLWYYFRGSKSSTPPKGTPQVTGTLLAVTSLPLAGRVAVTL